MVMYVDVGEVEVEEEEEEEEEGEEEGEEDYSPEPPSLFEGPQERVREEPLYPGASISVLAACTFLWTLVKTAAWRVEPVEMLLHFMATTLLPHGNKLLRSMYLLQQVIGEPNMAACTYRMSANGCLIWHKRDERRLGIRPGSTAKCTTCATELFRMHAGIWVPVSKVYYFGVASMVR